MQKKTDRKAVTPIPAESPHRPSTENTAIDGTTNPVIHNIPVLRTMSHMKRFQNQDRFQKARFYIKLYPLHR